MIEYSAEVLKEVTNAIHIPLEAFGTGSSIKETGGDAKTLHESTVTA